jgi:hypothetical protein
MFETSSNAAVRKADNDIVEYYKANSNKIKHDRVN